MIRDVNDNRRLEIWDKEIQSWVHAPALDQLEEGDLFRMYEPDGTPVTEGKIWRATGTPSVPSELVEDFEGAKQ